MSGRRATKPSHIAMRCWPHLPTDARTFAAIPPAAIARPHSAVFAASASRSRRPGATPAACTLTIAGRGLGGLSAPCRRARRRQLGQHDADARRHPGRPPLPGHDDRRRLPAPPADAPRHRAPGADGRPHRVGGRPAPDFDSGCRRHSSQSSFHPRCPARRSRAPCCWPVCMPAVSRRVTEPLPTRDHTERALQEFGVRVEARERSVSVTGRPAAPARESRGSRRHLVGGILDGRRGVAFGLRDCYSTVWG